MKQLLIMTLLILSNLGFSQEKDLKTETEKFGGKSGRLLKKEFFEIGKVNGVEISTLKVTDMNDDVSQSALRFTYQTYGTYSKTKIAHLDKDEIDGLILSIQEIKNKILLSTPTTYTEVTYKSNTGFEFGAFSSKKDKIWKSYLQVDKYDSDSMVTFKEIDLEKLLEFVTIAKNQM